MAPARKRVKRSLGLEVEEILTKKFKPILSILTPNLKLPKTLVLLFKLYSNSLLSLLEKVYL